MTSVTLHEEKVKDAIERSHSSGLPLLVCLIATKACYIKFSGLVLALAEADYPFVAIESGQHHEHLLTQGSHELGYHKHLGGMLFLSGDLAGKSAALFDTLDSLWTRLRVLGADKVLLAVCGDTLTAGIAPFAWYLITGQRSVHIESGLRSMAPSWKWTNHFLDQRHVPWYGQPTRPYPEGLCTRIATVASQQLFAPVERNLQTLLSEGYDPSLVTVCGSPSVDAVDYARRTIAVDELAVPMDRLRIDIHRRENLTFERLNAIFDGICRLSDYGIPIEFVITKSMQNCKGLSWDQNNLKMIEDAGVMTSLQTASYISVIRFLLSKPLAILTDSGGLQEETAVLGVPCMTCRFETDRPETVLDFKTNILVPPVSGESIFKTVKECLESDTEKIWPGLGKHPLCYGTNVGEKIVNRLKEFTPDPPNTTSLR